MRRKSLEKKKGIALLMSVLILSVVLSVSLTMMAFVIKQFQISASTQQSVLAIYAADAGIECALLWDIRGTDVALYGDYVFATSSANLNAPANSNLNCFGVDITDPDAPDQNYTVVSGALNATTDFEISFPVGNPTSCTRVTVDKDSNGGSLTTSILSRGYNVACDSVNAGTNIVERAIRVDYVFN